MSLTPGTTLGLYEVVTKIGEGGMGEVYRARDTKLDRDVALKVLPQAFTDDPDRLARFEREAKVLASLNHPNIGHIYGLEEAEGQKALVLELVEGPTLADRIAQGPIPVDEALPIAKQIAEALEAAHEQGVIHRDLKPANVKVRPDGMVKVLDFGLAKAFEPEPGSVSASMSPTISLTAAATQMGMVIGTAAYMAPEQAKGKVVDKRADVWAFGAVLFEMLTGQKPFSGDDVSTTLARVIEREPEWDALPNSLSPVLVTYVRRCLAKEPKQRIPDIAAVRLAMEGAFELPVEQVEPVPPQLVGWRRVLPWVAGLALAVVAALSVWTVTRPPATLPMRLNLVPPSGVEATGILRLSPDGRTLAFGGGSGDMFQVYFSSFDRVEAVPVRGTEGMAPLGFSPDGQELLVADRSLRMNATMKRVPLGGGPGTVVTEGVVGGADWGDNDTIILGGAAGLRLVRASGGEETLLTTPAPGDLGHFGPTLLPNGRGAFFYTWGGTAETTQVAVYDFDTGEWADLLTGTSPVFAPSGHLIFWRDGSVWAAPFDPERLALGGDPMVMIEGVATYFGADAAAYTLSDTGTLAYLPAGRTTSTLGWVNRAGEMTSVVSEGQVFGWPRLSPNGRHVAFSRGTESDADLWVRDLESGRETKLTVTGGQANQTPAWTPDGTTVTFASNRGGGVQLHTRPVDLSRETEQLWPTEGSSLSPSWAPDGETLVYYALNATGDRDIWRLPIGGDPVPFLATEFNERAPRLSPNGKWVAYTSNQPGENRVFVQAFPEGGRVFSISTSPGEEAVWSRDGRELFYRSGDEMWGVDVETEPGFAAGNPRVLFTRRYEFERNNLGNPNYDVSPDGQQFLMVRNDAAEATGYTVVLNWTEELKRLVPID